MDIGVALWSLQSTAAAPTSLPVAYARLRDDARRVEAWGYHSLWLAEHRFWYDGWCPEPLVAAASAAAVTERLRFGTGMLLLPQRDPHRLATTVAAFAELFGERLDLGVGLGHRDAEFDGLGLRRPDRGRRMDAGLDVLLAGPHPPLWIGGLADAAIRRGARRGLNFLLPQTLYPDEVAAMAATIRSEADDAGVTPGRVGILKDAWVEAHGPAARERLLPLLATHYREEAGSWWVLKGEQHGFDAPELLDRQLRRIVETPLVGDPDEVTRDLAGLRDVGVDLVVLRFHFDVTAGESARAMADFANHVLPEFAKAGAP